MAQRGVVAEGTGLRWVLQEMSLCYCSWSAELLLLSACPSFGQGFVWCHGSCRHSAVSNDHLHGWEAPRRAQMAKAAEKCSRGATGALLAAGAGHGAPRGGILARWSCALPAHPAGRGGGSGTSLEPQPRLAPALLLLHSCRRSWGCVARAALPRWVPRCRWPGAGLGASRGRGEGDTVRSGRRQRGVWFQGVWLILGYHKQLSNSTTQTRSDPP